MVNSKTARKQRVKLILQASNIRNPSSFSLTKSSPFAVVTKLAARSTSDEPSIIGQTEPILNSSHPQWTKYFTLDYDFGKELFLDISVYDYVSKKLLGSAKIEVGRVLGKRHNQSSQRMKPSGTLFAQILPLTIPMSEKIVNFSLNSGLRPKVNAYFEVHKRDFFETVALWTAIYRSNCVYVKGTIQWENCSIPLYDVATNRLVESSSDTEIYQCPIRILLWEHKKTKRHKVIGSIETTIAGLMDACQNGTILWLQESSGREYIKVQYIHISEREDVLDCQPQDSSEPISPTLQIRQTRAEYSSLIPKPTFIDYITGGCELDLSVAIDFTASNGNPMIPGTPHYIDSNSLNEYEKAIIAIGSIVTKYDTDQKSHVWGFGAKYEGITRHAFQLGDHSHVSGVKGILTAYRQTFARGLCMSSPVVITDVIRIAAKRARAKLEKAQEEGKQSYSILLILTHGCVSDIEATKNVLKEVANSPLSIVLVGIGDNDFSAMKFLDDFQKKEGGRDICNFVKFSASQDRVALAKDTLREVPFQLSSYFISRNIMPLAPSDQVVHTVSVEEDASSTCSDVIHTFDSFGEPHLEDQETAYVDRDY